MFIITCNSKAVDPLVQGDFLVVIFVAVSHESARALSRVLLLGVLQGCPLEHFNLAIVHSLKCSS